MRRVFYFVLVIWFYSLPVSAFFERYLPEGQCSFSVDYSTYSLCYEPGYRQASWVKYYLDEAQINGDQKRTNDYRQDSSVPDPVTKSDYRGSGFDRGHLIPAADRKLDRQSMSETFLMTNMSPQVGPFNQGIWARMERKMRDLVLEHGAGHVVTGPILNSQLGAISSGVAVPEWFFKIIYIPGEQLMRAYLIANERPASGSIIEEFEVTVDEIEFYTGLDFFADLPDSLEECLESSL